MKLKVIGSGSDGNTYLLDDGEQILVVEAGVPFKEVKEAINYEVSRIVGVLSTHEHGDHRKYLHEYIKAGIKCFSGNAVKLLGSKPFCTNVTKMGDFKVYPFEVPHDVPCYGYKIVHRDIGELVFVTDAKYVGYTFPGVNHIMVEANYSQDILDENMASGVIPQPLRNRIMKSHMSFETALNMVKANKNPQLMNVILCHLSSRNSDKKRFTEKMQEVVGPCCNVTIAKKGIEVDLSLVPF